MQQRLAELEETTKVRSVFILVPPLNVFFIRKELTSLKYRNEITNNELNSKLKTLTEEHQQAKDEIAKYRKTNTSLENDIHQYEKTVNHLRTKIALVEQDMKSKQEVIQQTNDRIAIEQDSKVSGQCTRSSARWWSQSVRKTRVAWKCRVIRRDGWSRC